jgi:hypothetical protein
MKDITRRKNEKYFRVFQIGRYGGFDREDTAIITTNPLMMTSAGRVKKCSTQYVPIMIISKPVWNQIDGSPVGKFNDLLMTKFKAIRDIEKVIRKNILCLFFIHYPKKNLVETRKTI